MHFAHHQTNRFRLIIRISLQRRSSIVIDNTHSIVIVTTSVIIIAFFYINLNSFICTHRLCWNIGYFVLRAETSLRLMFASSLDLMPPLTNRVVASSLFRASGLLEFHQVQHGETSRTNHYSRLCRIPFHTPSTLV